MADFRYLTCFLIPYAPKKSSPVCAFINPKIFVKIGQFKTIYKYVLKFDFPNLQKNGYMFTIISQGKQNGHFLGNSGLFD